MLIEVKIAQNVLRKDYISFWGLYIFHPKRNENSSKGITDTYKQGMKKGVNLVIT